MLAYECGDVRDGEGTVQGKQAKIVSPTQERAILGYLATTRYPHRDRVMFLLSMKAGLRAKEMAALTWAMVTDAAGQIAERAGRCWGLCRHRHLIHLKVHVRIPALEDGAQLPVQRSYSRL